LFDHSDLSQGKLFADNEREDERGALLFASGGKKGTKEKTLEPATLDKSGEKGGRLLGPSVSATTMTEEKGGEERIGRAGAVR